MNTIESERRKFRIACIVIFIVTIYSVIHGCRLDRLESQGKALQETSIEEGGEK